MPRIKSSETAIREPPLVVLFLGPGRGFGSLCDESIDTPLALLDGGERRCHSSDWSRRMEISATLVLGPTRNKQPVLAKNMPKWLFVTKR